MSAILCGKRSFFEESSPAAVPKRIRCSSSSPIRFSPSPPRQTSSSPSRTGCLVERLIVIFPDMEKELLEKALQECGDDLDSAIRRLHELRLGSSHNDAAASVDTSNAGPESNIQLQSQANIQLQSQGDLQTEDNVPSSGAEWVELFVGEMMSASNVDDAKARASKALEVLEKSIVARVTAEASQNFLQENTRLKQQVEALIQENGWLKRLVSIQHERQKEHEEDRSKELEHLKQVVSQYQEQLRTLEVNNYALTMHLKQAQQSSSIPGRFNPDIF